MKRLVTAPRENWKETVEGLGLMWHSNRGEYWNDKTYYSFTMDEVTKIEKVTQELHALCLKAVEHVITNKLYDRLHIPAFAVPMIEESWDMDSASLYGRFDLSYDGLSEPKMLEYNADTPTSLIEAALVQWHWLQEKFPNNDQFNSIHEHLVDVFKDLKEGKHLRGDTLYFTSIDDVEDAMTVSYIRDCAEQAGLKTKYLPIDQIGISDEGRFVDDEDNIMHSVFKLYPWEWMINEEFGKEMLELGSGCQWIEPAWKMILSNKGILPILHELFPNHPNILKASFEEVDTVLWESFVKKPIFSREGAGVTVTMFDQTLAKSETNGYGAEGFIFQELATIPNFENNYAVIGSWIIGQEACGMGVRESTNLISDNLSRFVPHIIEG